MGETYSPWIYFEIICTQIVRNKPLIAYRDYYSLSHDLFERFCSESANTEDKIQISYTISLSHLLKLDEDVLIQWKKKNDYCFFKNMYQFEYPLDFLYSLVCPLDVDMAEKMSKKISSEECMRIRRYYEGVEIDAQDKEKVRHIFEKCFVEDSIIID